MVFIDILLCLLALTILIPIMVLLIQVLMSLPAYQPASVPNVGRPSVAILIPAHDEEFLIASTLHTIVPQLVEGDRVLVVADNCSDDTMKIAAAAGAEVVERIDPDHRGKGYALDFGVRHLARSPRQVVLIIDADCNVDRGSVDRLARVCIASGRPVQSLYLMRATLGADLRTRVAEFAWLLKGKVRTLGYHRLGLPSQLMGTGMAFLWSDISSAALAGGHLQEETKLGLDLTKVGKPQMFCPEASVTSAFPSSSEGFTVQRMQWEHGHLGIILGSAPRLLAHAFANGNVKLIALVLDLCVPPIALLTLVSFILFMGSAANFAITHAVLSLWLTSIAMTFLFASVLLAWYRHGREVISLRSLAYAPIYALWKIPLYVKFVLKRHTAWVRTRRQGE